MLPNACMLLLSSSPSKYAALVSMMMSEIGVGADLSLYQWYDLGQLAAAIYEASVEIFRLHPELLGGRKPAHAHIGRVFARKVKDPSLCDLPAAH